MKKRDKIVLIIMATVFCVIMINTFLNSRWEYQGAYNFKITKIKVAGNKSLSFYNNLGERISLQNFIISENRGVRVGDSISKKPCADNLYVFRTDSTGKVNLFMEFEHSGMFPRSFFCK